MAMPGVPGPNADARVTPFVLAVLIVALGVTAVLGGANIPRPGYILDEEITFAVAPALSRHGVPTLPSGVVYLRGLPYSYLAWLWGLPFGHTLATYRSISLLFALAGIIVLFRLGRAAAATPAKGAVAAALLACTPAYAAISAFARPYSLFVAAFSLTVWLFVRARAGRTGYTWFFAGLVLCRLLHEFGLSLVLLPLACAAAMPPPDRTRMLSVFWKSVVLAAGLELALYVGVQTSLTHLYVPLNTAPAFRPVRLAPLPPLHVLAVATPISLVVVALPLAALAWLAGRRTNAWGLVVSCALLGLLFLLGPMIALVCLAIVARPQRTARYAAIGIVMFIASAAVWTLHTIVRTDAQLSWAVARSLVAGVVHYPFGGVRYFAAEWPATAVAAAVGIVSLARREARGAGVAGLRALALFSSVILLAFGALGLDLEPRFLLLGFPVFLILAAEGIHAAAIGNALVVVVLVGVIAVVQNVFAGEPPLRAIGPLRSVSSDDVVVCSEELACRYLFGRVNYLMLTSPTDLGYYAGWRDGRLRGLYANTPVVSTAADLENVVRTGRATRSYSIVILRTGKVDGDAMERIAGELAARSSGRTTSNEDATIVYLGATGTGAAAVSMRSEPVADRRSPTTSPSMTSR